MSDEEAKEQTPRGHNTTSVHCKTSNLQVGDWLSGTVYYQVKRSTPDASHECVDNLGKSVKVGNPVLEREMVSASQFDETKEVSRTEMIEKLMGAKSTVFTVKFRKQLTGKRLKEEMDAANYDEQTTPAKKQKILDKVLKQGEQRKLVGYLLDVEPSMGRSQVFDLEQPKGQFNQRQVDHRTVEELILNRVKYQLK